MKHLAQRLFSKTPLLSSGLALVACALMTTAPASAQRRGGPSSTQWEIGVTKDMAGASAALRVGSQGASLNLRSSSRARLPRGYDGGRYEYRSERVWVPGFNRQVWVPPVYEWRYDPCGRRTRVCVRAGYHRTDCVPGRYEVQQVKVWVPAPRIDLRRRGRYQGRDSRFDDRRRQSSSPIRAHRVSHRSLR